MAYTAQPVGTLAQLVSQIHLYTDEPEVTDKWTSDRLWPLIVSSWERCMQDAFGVGDAPLVMRYQLPVDSGTQTYVLPKSVGQILRVGKYDAASGQTYDTVLPRSRLNPSGSGVSFEGNTIRFEPLWAQSETLVIEYIPNGYVALHMSDFDDTSVTNTTLPDGSVVTNQINLNSDPPTEGYFDSDPGAYLGALIRVLSSTGTFANGLPETGYTYWPVQERMITAVDPTTFTVTVEPALPFALGPTSLLQGGIGATYKYEVVPMGVTLFMEAIVWAVAERIHGIAERMTRATYAEAKYREQMRSIRLRFSSVNQRTGSAFSNDVPGAGRYGWTIGSGVFV